eukprot:4458022-Prymnesium_polylepis.2
MHRPWKAQVGRRPVEWPRSSLDAPKRSKSDFERIFDRPSNCVVRFHAHAIKEGAVTDLAKNLRLLRLGAHPEQ